MKKRFVALLIMLVSIWMGISALAQGTAGISEKAAEVLSSEDAKLVEGVLSDYAALRAGSFASERTLMASDNRFSLLAAEEAQRSRTIREKNASIAIEVLSANVDMQANGAAYDENGWIELDVYEWISFSYDDLIDGVGGSDASGIGVYHVMLVEPNTGKVIMDAYDEGPATGVVSQDYLAKYGDPLWVRQSALSEQVEDEDGDRFLMFTRYEAYNPDACVAYADAYVYHGAAGGGTYDSYYNSAYTNFNPYGGDCANYTSQSINAGGMPQVSGTVYGTNGWFYVNSGNRSATWTGAPQLRTWMANNRGQVVNGPASDQVFKGSPCFYDWNNGGASYDHATICVGINSAGRAIINSHNNDYYHYVYNYGGYVSTVQLTAYNYTVDKTAPTIKYVRICGVNEDSYTVACEVSDNVGIAQVQFPTWSVEGEQDDIVWHQGTVSGNVAYCTIKRSEHNGESGPFHTHIYAFDPAGNVAKLELSGLMMQAKAGEQTLPDGDYYIQTMCSLKPKVLTIDGNSSANSANVHIWDTAFDPEHVWRVTHKGNGLYEIYNAKLGTSMDVASASMETAANLQAFERNNSEAQRWILRKTKTGDYNVISYRSGLLWDVNYGKTDNGTNVSMWLDDESVNQVFRFIPAASASDKIFEDGMVQLVPANDTEKVMAVAGASLENRATMVLDRYHKNDAAVFELQYLNNGCYLIKNKNSGHCLDVFSMHNTTGVPLEQGTVNGGFNQQWLLRDMGDGTFTIMSKSAGLYVARKDGAEAEGTQIILQNDAGSAARWSIVPYGFFVRYDLNGGEGSLRDGHAPMGGKIAVTNEVPEKIAHHFLGWATSKTATNPTHQPGQEVTGNEDVLLYALWKPFPLTVTKKTEEGYTTDLYNVEAKYFIVAQYQNGVLLSTVTKKAEQAAELITPIPGADEIKVMVWDTINGLIPLTDAELVSLK